GNHSFYQEFHHEMHLQSGKKCQDSLPYSYCSRHCNDSDIAQFLCPLTCRKEVNKEECGDHVGIACGEIPFICADPASAIHLCPKFCGMCAVLKAVHTLEDCLYPADCVDVAGTPHCRNNSDVCDDVLAPYMCSRTCGKCEFLTTVPPSSLSPTTQE
ncbi:hypothetical protein BaRGS_00038153, partial [Batillaria attramentaria]